MNESLSRRDVLQRGTALGLLAVVGATACGKKKGELRTPIRAGSRQPTCRFAQPSLASTDRSSQVSYVAGVNSLFPPCRTPARRARS
jgi:hypothetical protein